MSSRRAAAAVALAIALAIALGGTGAARADTQLWTRVGLTADLADDVGITVEQRTRFDENLTRLQGLLPQLSVAYQPLWSLTLGVGYRFAYQRRRRGDFEFAHRYHIDGQARHDLGDARLRYRLRLQERYRSRDGRLPTVRNRVGVDWRGLEPWVPRVTFGTFTRLGVERELDGTGGETADRELFHFHKWRLGVRLRYDFHRQSVAGFYRLEGNRSRPDDPRLHVLGLAYYYEL